MASGHYERRHLSGEIIFVLYSTIKEAKILNIITDISICTEINENSLMETLTISTPKELEQLKKKYPTVNWNKVMKQALLKKLEQLKQFEQFQKRGD